MNKRTPLLVLTFLSLSVCGVTSFSLRNDTDVAVATIGQYETDASTFYQGISAKSGRALLGQVHDLMASNHKYYTSYDECFDVDIVKATDPGSSSSYITDFYGQVDYQATKKVSGSTGWNREHVWCQSLSNGKWGKNGAGGDIHHIRPEDNKINSTRGNSPFGNVRAKYPNDYKTTTSSIGSFTGGYYYGNSMFEPLDSVKGDVARIIMYVYAHYNSPSYVGGSVDNSYFTKLPITNIMAPTTEADCWSLLLEWNKKDPVDEKERIRNDECASLTGTRNAFIDHPEYADAIWGNGDISGEESSSSSSSTSESSSSTMVDCTDFISNADTKAALKYKYSVTESVCDTPASFNKLTASVDDYSGTYLIVAEDKSVAFNGSLDELDVGRNNFGVSINNGVIAYDESLLNKTFTIDKYNNGYSIKSSSGLYIGANGKGSLETSPDSPFEHKISISNGKAVLTSGSNSLMFNEASGTSGERFRYYSSTTMKPVSLYKLSDGAGVIRNYEFEDMTLRFGAVLPYDDWFTLLDKKNVTGYGVVAGYVPSIRSIYQSSNVIGDSDKWIKDNGLLHESIRGNEDSLVINRCDSYGLSTDDDYLMWDIKIKVPNNEFDKKMTAVAYVIVDGQYLFAKERSESIKSLASKYKTSGLIEDKELIESLSKM